jgi:hypothetical protein
MSFDIYLLGFRNGKAVDGDTTAAMRILSRYFRAPPDNSFAHIVTSDGRADVYGVGKPSASLMFNHVCGEQAWQVVYEVAHQAGLVIVPIGCATLICKAEQECDLPPELRDDVRLVRSGADILRAIGRS